MVYCRRCGIHLNDGVKFCPNCGTFQSGSTPINSNKRVITIGRSSSCDICLGESAEYASTYHGTIFWNGTQLMYKDTSSNGTVINNMMVHGKTVPINHGDTILVADKYQITWEKIDSLLAPSSMSYQPTRLLKLNTVTSCRKCGTKLNVGSKYCHECGTPCNSFSSQSAGESGVVEQKKSSKVPIKALLSVIIVIALLCGGWFVWENWGKDYSLEGLAKAVVSYDYINHFYEGLAYVEKDGKYGFIDKTGKEIIPCIYDYVSYFNEGLSKVKKDGKYGFIDKTGKNVTPCIYDYFSEFHEGLAKVKKDGKIGVIDKTGKEIIPCIYDELSDFHEGIASVKKDEKHGFIDKTGKEIIPCISNYAFYFYEGLASVEKDGKYGFIDKTGKVVIPCIYDYVSEFHEGLAQVKKDGMFGFVDKKGYSTFDVENEEETDKLHWGYFLLCFLIPIVGFIYALSIRKKKPATSNQALMASLLGFVVSLILSYFMPMAISRYNEIKEAKLAREKFVKDSLEQVKLDSLYLVAQKEKEKLEAKRYEEFMEKLTFANLVSLLNNFDNVEYAKKCGLSLIYRNATKEEYGDDIEVVYGYDIEKGNKKEYGGYELIAKSNHSCYFRYVLDTSSGAKIFFKNADDANLLFERAKQYGLVIVANEYYTSYLIPNKRLPNGKSIKVEEPDYETVCGSISAPNYRDGWYIIALSQDG